MVDAASGVEGASNGLEASSVTSFGLRDTRHGCAGTSNTLIGVTTITYGAGKGECTLRTAVFAES